MLTIKKLLGYIPRQTFLFYNKQQLINVVISCYEQIKAFTDVMSEFIEGVNSGIYNGKDGKDGAPGLEGKQGPKGEQGIQGIKGDKGDKGDQGNKGDKGEPFVYSDFTEEQINDIKKPALDAAEIAHNAAHNAASVATELQDDIILNRQKVTEAINVANNANAIAETANINIEQASLVANNASNLAEQAINIAKGRATAYVFDTYEDMIDWIDDYSNILVIGDNLYIRDVNVTDYWWDGEKIQPLETESPNLDEYIKNTDYATTNTAGIVKIAPSLGLNITSNSGIIYTVSATYSDINSKIDMYKPITSSCNDYAVKVGITTNTIELTDTEKANAKKWLGFAPLTQAEYEALIDKTGINFVIPDDYDN